MANETQQLSVNVYNHEGGVVGTHTLDPRIFDVTIPEELVHFVVVAQDANARKVLAHTKTRAEVSGGGKKPWKQKGTGRARHGSTRSPIWRKGGITFGPRNDRNFSMKVNKKVKRKALFGVLSDKVRQGHLVIVENFDVTPVKTKRAFEILKALPLSIDKVRTPHIGVVVPRDSSAMQRSSRNLEYIRMMGSQSLNIKDVLHAEYLLMSATSIDEIVSLYFPANK
ncbi:MAG: 50S ribosomal protein L4 [bacterium]|nr:50S ribosomal protein L4 [bacterium]